MPFNQLRTLSFCNKLNIIFKSAINKNVVKIFTFPTGLKMEEEYLC